jgi:hypothetical protein
MTASKTPRRKNSCWPFRRPDRSANWGAVMSNVTSAKGDRNVNSEP